MAIRTEHNSAKNRRGYWGKRAHAKQVCRGLRRREDLRLAHEAKQQAEGVDR